MKVEKLSQTANTFYIKSTKNEYVLQQINGSVFKNAKVYNLSEFIIGFLVAILDLSSIDTYFGIKSSYVE